MSDRKATVQSCDLVAVSAVMYTSNVLQHFHVVYTVVSVVL